MKNKFVVLNLWLSIAVLGSMLFQSVHSYEHIFEQLSQKKCHHQQLPGTQITHDHHGFDQCFVCEFTFSNITKTDFFTFNFLQTSSIFQTNLFLFSEKVSVFSTNLFSLRGPPQFF